MRFFYREGNLCGIFLGGEICFGLLWEKREICFVFYWREWRYLFFYCQNREEFLEFDGRVSKMCISHMRRDITPPITLDCKKTMPLLSWSSLPTTHDDMLVYWYRMRNRTVNVSGA